MFIDFFITFRFQNLYLKTVISSYTYGLLETCKTVALLDIGTIFVVERLSPGTKHKSKVEAFERSV